MNEELGVWAGFVKAATERCTRLTPLQLAIAGLAAALILVLLIVLVSLLARSG